VKRRWVISLAAVVVAAIMVIAFWPGAREPEYQGKKLSEWLEPYAAAATTPDSILKSDSDVQAVRHIGTNALPFLVKWIREETPLWQRSLPALTRKAATAISGNSVVRSIVDDPGVSHGAAACAAFWVLGPEAGSAVPELSRIANNANAPEAAAFRLGFGNHGFDILHGACGPKPGKPLKFPRSEFDPGTVNTRLPFAHLRGQIFRPLSRT